jgi:hypothetical protein
MTAELFAPFFLSPPDKKKSSVFAKKWTICQKVEDFRQKIVDFRQKIVDFRHCLCLLKMDDLPKSRFSPLNGVC